ncbi:MAG: hypothetical protein EOM14_16660, partial [Clostridia bacterium]|nr:hypothetical protein [Clostridia bacterium]
MEYSVYDTRRRVVVTAIDMNRNGVIDYSGTDIIKKYEYSVVENDGKVSYKTVEKGYLNDGSGTETVMRESYNSADALYASQSLFSRTAATQSITYNGSGSFGVLATNPDASTITQNYSNGKLLSAVHSVLGTTTYTYDQFNRQISSSSTVNGSSRVNSQELDSLGRPSVVTDAAGRETVFTYDQQGRRVKAELPGNRAVYYRYYPTGELKEQFGSDIYPQRYIYDSVGRMKSLETYKAFRWTGPQSGYKTIWTYSTDRGFMTSKTYPDSQSVNYTYNADGSLATRVWARGITTTYGYDNAGALSGITYSDGTTPAVSYTRNRMSLPVSITDGTGTRTLTYNSDSTLASETIPYIVSGSVSY